MENLLTAEQIAKELGKSVEAIRKIAAKHNIGTKLGRDWIFTEQDIKAFEAIPGPGRPFGAKDSRPRKIQKT